MKISDIIARFDALKPNKYSATVKLGWINHVDGAVWNELYKYTGFSNIMRLKDVAAYALPAGVDFNLVTNVFVDGEEIFLITFKDFETTGYYRGADGKLNIYPIPTVADSVAGLREVHKLPFVPHVSIDEDIYIPAPFDKVYDDYLTAMVDKYNQEMDKYQNSMNFYNASFDEYADFYRGRT